MLGTGTAICDPCTVRGLTGAVTFDLSVAGLAETDTQGNVNSDLTGGTWTITSATGGLTGLTGRGTYGLEPVRGLNVTTADVFIGSYNLGT